MTAATSKNASPSICSRGRVGSLPRLGTTNIRGCCIEAVTSDPSATVSPDAIVRLPPPVAVNSEARDSTPPLGPNECSLQIHELPSRRPLPNRGTRAIPTRL